MKPATPCSAHRCGRTVGEAETSGRGGEAEHAGGAVDSGAEGRGSLDELLRGCRQGDRAAFDSLFALLYDELRAIARRHLRELRGAAGETLNTTALLHESYLRLAGGAPPRWQQRAQFFAVASKAMRHILVDHARRRSASKRGGDAIRVTLDAGAAAMQDRVMEVLALDEALSRLAAKRPRLEAIVECRFFGGLTVEETAAALHVSVRTVERDWTRARTYLYRMLSPQPRDQPEQTER